MQFTIITPEFLLYMNKGKLFCRSGTKHTKRVGIIRKFGFQVWCLTASLHKTIKKREITQHWRYTCICGFSYTSSRRPMLLNWDPQRGRDMGTLTVPGVQGMWSPLADNHLLTNTNPRANLPTLRTHSLEPQEGTAPNVSWTPYAMGLSLWEYKVPFAPS